MTREPSHVFFEEVLNEVRSLPIESILDNYIQIQSKGRKILGLCPFHGDRSFGSFVINPKFNTFRCFSCGESGDLIQIVREVRGDKSKDAFKNAVLEIGVAGNIITEDQVLQYKEGMEINGEIQKGEENNREYYKQEPLDVELISKVYEVFSEGCELVGKPRLSEEHLSILQKERYLTQEEIESVGFFSFPKREILFNFYMEIWERFQLHPWNVLNVPGFFWGTKIKWKDPITESPFYPLLFSELQGIGIPIRNADGKIVAIQVRRDKKDDHFGRYVFFSSSYAAEKEGDEINGASPGSPVDVVYPLSDPTQTLYITEGKFKALALARCFRGVSISVQGVTTWKNIKSEISKLKASVSKVAIVYDADSLSNPAVFTQLCALAEYCKQELELEVHIVIWDEKYGVGIDDVFINRNWKNLRSISMNDKGELLSKALSRLSTLKGDAVEEKRELLTHLKEELLDM